MSQQPVCPHCSRPMFATIRHYDLGRVQKLVHCPKCRYDVLGDIMPGYLEVNRAFHVRISARGVPSASALRVLRRTLPELANMPPTTLARRLEDGVVTVESFSFAQISGIRAELQTVGLVVELDEEE